jgi:hypothetical protein
MIISCILSKLIVRRKMADKAVNQSARAVYRREFSPSHYSGYWYLHRRSFYLKNLLRESKKRYGYTTSVLDARSSGNPLAGGSALTADGGLRHYAVIRARLELLRRWIIDPIMIALCLSTFVGYITIGVLVADRQNVPDPLIAGMLAFLFPMASMFAFLYLFPERMFTLSYLALVIALCAGAAYLRDPSLSGGLRTALLGPTSAGKIAREAAYCMSMSDSLILLLIVGALAMALIESIVLGRYERSYANVKVLDDLIKIQRFLADHPTRTSDSMYKKHMSRSLEIAATRVEKNLPRSIALANPFLQEKLQQQFTGAAAALRLMQLRLLLSEESTIVDIRGEVREFIHAIASGNYALMPTMDPLPKRSRSKMIFSACRDMVIAFTPIAILEASNYAGLKLPSQILSWGTAVCLLWAIITIVSFLDPLYKARIATLQDIASIFRNSGK